jgi:hypothetical protein
LDDRYREVVGLEALLEANKKEVERETQRPFNSWMETSTVHRYTEVWKQMGRARRARQAASTQVTEVTELMSQTPGKRFTVVDGIVEPPIGRQRPQANDDG